MRGPQLSDHRRKKPVNPFEAPTFDNFKSAAGKIVDQDATRKEPTRSVDSKPAAECSEV